MLNLMSVFALFFHFFADSVDFLLALDTQRILDIVTFRAISAIAGSAFHRHDVEVFVGNGWQSLCRVRPCGQCAFAPIDVIAFGVILAAVCSPALGSDPRASSQALATRISSTAYGIAATCLFLLTGQGKIFCSILAPFTMMLISLSTATSLTVISAAVHLSRWI